MATESIQVSEIIPASAERIYHAWLDAAEHAAMTGGSASSEVRVGGQFSAWDGYIRGTHLELDPGRRIVQSWRTSDFPDASPDSRLVVLLEADPAGARVTLVHSDIPEGQGADYQSGWREHYFEPMKRYFSQHAPALEPAHAHEPAHAPEPLPPPPAPPITAPPIAAVPAPVHEPEPTPVRPFAIAMPPAEEWEEAATIVKPMSVIPSSPVKEPAHKPAAKKPARAAAKKPVRAAAKKPARKAAAKKPAKKPVKKAAAKKPAKPKVAAKKSPARKPAQKPTKKPAKKPAKKPSQKPSKKGKR